MLRILTTAVAIIAWLIWLLTLALSRNGDDVRNTYHTVGGFAVIVAIVSSAAAAWRSQK